MERGCSEEWRGKGWNNYIDKRLMCGPSHCTYTSSSPNEFRLKWVDDTHALGIFASDRQGTVCQLCGRI